MKHTLSFGLGALAATAYVTCGGISKVTELLNENLGETNSVAAAAATGIGIGFGVYGLSRLANYFWDQIQKSKDPLNKDVSWLFERLK